MSFSHNGVQILTATHETTERVTMIFRLLYHRNLFLRRFPPAFYQQTVGFFGVACKISRFIQSELTNCVLQR